MMVGDKLTVEPGTWGPAPVKLSVRWLRDGKAIPNATALTYTLTSDDVGKRVKVEVTGARSRYLTTTKLSAETSVVYARAIRPVVEPAVRGTAVVGAKLTAAVGQWLPAGTQSSVVWLRDGKPIKGAEGTTYVVTEDDHKRTISIRVTTVLPKYQPDVRVVSSERRIRAVPKFTVKAVPSKNEHSMQLMITARGVGKQLSGAVRILENGKRLNTVPLSQRAPTRYEYKAEPGKHVLTFTYIGPDWLVPISQAVPITIK
jgi:hypothetical protein